MSFVSGIAHSQKKKGNKKKSNAILDGQRSFRVMDAQLKMELFYLLQSFESNILSNMGLVSFLA